MSNSSNKRKCPNCGAMMPVEVKYCRKCQARMDMSENDLPRPIRPEREHDQQETGIEDLSARRREQSGGQASRSRQTRTRESYESSRSKEQQKDGGSPWRAVAVLALIAVIIVVAVVLVIKLHKTGEDEIQQESQTYDGIYVVEASTAPETEDDIAAEAEDVPSSVEDGDETMTDEEDEYTAVSDVVYTTGSGVNLRSGPGTDYEVMASVSSGTELARSAITGNWSEVTYEGQVCYVNNSLITTEAPEEDDDDTAAEEDYTVTATDATTVYVISDVNLRTGPGTSYDAVAVATAGTELTRTGTTGLWSQVEYNGQTVYAYSSYLSTTAVSADDTADDTTADTTTSDVPTSTEDVVSAGGTIYTTDGVNLRTGPGTNYDIVTSVPAGTALTRTGTTGEWTEVSYSGQTAYVYNVYISTDSTDAELSSQSGTLTIVSEANVRSGPGTSYEVLGVAAVGDTLTITGYTSTNWYQVEYDGGIGYIAGNLVSAG